MSTLSEGFGERNNAQFWNVKNGLLCKRCDEHTEGASKQNKEDGTVYYEIQKPNFTGRLVKVDIREAKIGDKTEKFLDVHFLANKEVVKIGMKLDSGYGFGFLSTIPSAKIDGLILIAPFYKEADGKKETKIFIKDETCEGKEWCKQFFTKDNPNGLPDLEKTTYKGKEVWDNTKRLAYFENTLIPKLNEGLKKIWGDGSETAATTSAPKAEPKAAPKPEPVHDDLPF
jgi:hypothetical protein